jgi:energy-coupling factor transport system ATP-binding protein
MPLAVKNIAYTYQAKTPYQTRAINNISIKVSSGEIMGVTGHSGSGKSTLLLILAGMLKPDQGAVELEDDSCRLLTPDQGRVWHQRVGLVQQFPERQIFERLVYDEIAYGPRNMDMNRQQVMERVLWSMQQVGLDYHSMKDRQTCSLSGGEQRRVAIASILAMKPSYLLLDEPAAGLDYWGQEQLFKVLCQLAAQSTGIIMVSHNMNHLSICDRLLIIDRGTMVLEAACADLPAYQPQLLPLGLKLAAYQDLITRLLHCGWPLSRRVQNREQAAELIIQKLRQGAGH